MSPLKLLTSLLLIFLCSAHIQEHYNKFSCQHDQIEHNTLFHDFGITIPDNDLSISSTGSSFRIVPDYSTLKTDNTAMQTYITKNIIPPVLDYFKATLKLKFPMTKTLKLPDTPAWRAACGGIPAQYLTTGIDADLVLLVRAVNDQKNGFVAKATTCGTDTTTKRVTMATITFNLAYFKVDNGDLIVHENNIYTTLHEMVHVFGFSFTQFGNFLLPDGKANKNVVINTTIEGKPETIINVEPLTSKLKKYFGCSKIPGAILENQGTGGSRNSHFERRIFLNELMTASSIQDCRLTEFTLALLEGTGWYVVDYSNAEPFVSGAGLGCDFYLGHCKDNKFTEYCNKHQDRTCSESYGSGGTCSFEDDYGDGCGIPHPRIEFDCRNPNARADLLKEAQVFGPTARSKCFLGTLIQHGFRANALSNYCFTNKCIGSGSTANVQVNIGKTSVICKKAGPMDVPGYAGQLICPDPVDFCAVTGTVFCERGCMGRGTCSNGQCKCRNGFYGYDCSYTY